MLGRGEARGLRGESKRSTPILKRYCGDLNKNSRQESRNRAARCSRTVAERPPWPLCRKDTARKDTRIADVKVAEDFDGRLPSQSRRGLI